MFTVPINRPVLMFTGNSFAHCKALTFCCCYFAIQFRPCLNSVAVACSWVELPCSAWVMPLTDFKKANPSCVCVCAWVCVCVCVCVCVRVYDRAAAWHVDCCNVSEVSPGCLTVFMPSLSVLTTEGWMMVAPQGTATTGGLTERL